MSDSSRDRHSGQSLQEIELLKKRVAELEQANALLEAREGRYGDLIEHAKDMIWTLDVAGNVIFLNSACEAITGYSKQELVGKGLTDLVAPENLDAAREALTRKWEHEKTTHFEIQILAKDGHAIELEVSSAILERAGKPAGVLAIARDITERKALQEQLQQSRKLEAVGRLAGGIAHDFNNLLTVIAGYSQLLLNRINGEHPMHAGLEQIRQSADKAAVLTRQLLAFSKRQSLQPGIVDLNTVVTDMEKMLRRLIGEQIELVTKLALDLGRVRADSSQIEQVIMNLALNARDAMPGGGTLTIETANVEFTMPSEAAGHRPGAYAMVSVTDTGEGIDDQIRSHLFEPFFTTRGQREGLGLSVVYGMVEQHGGFILVATEPGDGARFDVCLPLLPHIPDPSDIDFVESVGAGGNETILVVEDEEGVLKLITETLRSYGYTVLEANDGAKALQFATSERPRVDLLLTDVVMPKLNGRALADAWRLLQPDLKVLYISGYARDEQVDNMFSGLGDRLLQKPFSGTKLAREVRETLDARKA